MTRSIRFAAALTEALAEEMERDSNVIVFGEDVGHYGGVFKVTSALRERFGDHRVFDTPISENGIVGAAVGMAMSGLRPVVEIMYSDFLPLALDSIINGAAMLPFIYGDQVEAPLVIRTQGGNGVMAGAQHSKSLELLVAHIPGIHTVMPSDPAAAKGLLKSAIRSDAPVLFLEHKLLYNKKGDVPDADTVIPLGTARVIRTGQDISIITISYMVQLALEAATILEKEGYSIEIVDVQSLRPLDTATILDSVIKTKRAMCVAEPWLCYGPTAEWAAIISSEAFDVLKAPVARLGGPGVPIPASPQLEPYTRPDVSRIVETARTLMRRS